MEPGKEKGVRVGGSIPEREVKQRKCNSKTSMLVPIEEKKGGNHPPNILSVWQ